jgi:hypothetical protein
MRQKIVNNRFLIGLIDDKLALLEWFNPVVLVKSAGLIVNQRVTGMCRVIHFLIFSEMVRASSLCRKIISSPIGTGTDNGPDICR